MNSSCSMRKPASNIGGCKLDAGPALIYPLAADYVAMPSAWQIHFFLYNGEQRPLRIDKVWLNRDTGSGVHPDLPAYTTPSTILPGMVGEVTVNKVGAVAYPRQINYPVLDGFDAGFTLPKSPLPVALHTIAFTADPRVFTVTLRNVSAQAITLTGLEVFPITNKVATLAPAVPLRLNPGEERRVSVTMKQPLAPGNYIWCAALIEQCRVAGCVMAHMVP